jgi:hypothetical protein
MALSLSWFFGNGPIIVGEIMITILAVSGGWVKGAGVQADKTPVGVIADGVDDRLGQL